MTTRTPSTVDTTAPVRKADASATSGVRPNTAVIGLQWGDEGKGKVIDLIAGGFDAVVRFNGGANAGHSVVFGGKRHALHLIPSGVFNPRARAVIGNGVVIDPAALVSEIDRLTAAGANLANLALSSRAHVVMPYHKAEDELREVLLAAQTSFEGEPETPSALAAAHGPGRSIGTTRRGIGPAYSDKANRSTSIRIGDLLQPATLRDKITQTCAFKNAVLGALNPTAPSFDAGQLTDAALVQGERLRPHITDTVYLLHDMLKAGKSLLFEGANATLLDVDHGTYPYVTSSGCSALGIPAGTGVPGSRLGEVIGILKAYSTRVGGGPFPTELSDASADRIRERGREYGTTTGRPRRCGWLDLVAVRYSAMINGATALSVMLLDVLAGFDELKVCTAYEIDGVTTDRFLPDASQLAHARARYQTLPGFSQEITSATSRGALPDNARRYVDFIEEFVGVPVKIISVGPDRVQTIQD